MEKPEEKFCHECGHFEPPPAERPWEDPVCKAARNLDSLKNFPLLYTVKFQRASRFLPDCGPDGRLWTPRG